LREERLAELEQALAYRLREADERESDLVAREARLEGDAAVREAAFDRREAELAELEARLGRKERELAAYVAQLQADLNGGGTQR
jgi:Skp family chaperone for outer membrane proteins